jgi:DNA topoisomerase-1
LQQEAARKLGFNAERTMRLAQQLYEGVELEQGATGLITYMRTDSVNIANEATNEMRQYIEEQYGKQNLPNKPRHYRKQSKNAQEAHEAIRPTSVLRTPDSVKQALTNDQLKLYQLIWRRTVACQMVHATMNTMTVDLLAGNDHYFRATGSSVAHPGFMIVYQEDQDDVSKQEADDKMLPDIEQGQRLDLNDVVGQQHFTEPPPRYSEASLVKILEEYGIGRPSTYASILSTLRQRYYVTMANKRFVPTDIGRTVNYFLTEYFPRYVDYGFTAQLEDELDAISRGEEAMIPLLEKFWHPFKDRVQQVEQSVSKKDVTQTELDEQCPECGKHLVKRLGKRGHFIGCSGYPDCRYTRGLEDSKDDAPSETIEGKQCPKCDSQLEIKRGRYGKFIGCSNYPNCKHVEPLEKPQDTEIKCPKCHNHTLLKRKTRRGKYFFACAGYPDCQYAVWDPPYGTSCPKCQWPILTIKTTKKHGQQWFCPQKECDYRETVE